MVGLIVVIISILGLVGEVSLKTVCIVGLCCGGLGILNSIFNRVADRKTRAIAQAILRKEEETNNEQN